jgi:hypothetical protein
MWINSHVVGMNILYQDSHLRVSILNTTAVNETMKWLDASQEGSEEDYREKQRELEAIVK